MLRLSALAFRRVLPSWLAAGLVALLVLAARVSHDVPLIAGDAQAQLALRALARQNVWSVLFVLAPLLVLRAARLGTERESAWLRTLPAARPRLALALAAGCVGACLTAVLLTAAVCEATLASVPEAWRRARASANPTALFLDEPGAVLRWSIPAPAPGERLRLWTTVAVGAGPAASARFTARSGAATSVAEARVAGRTALELTPPVGGGATLELELERVGPGAPLVLPPEALEILAPVASERWVAWELGSRALVLLASASCLALGLARGLRPVLATGLVFSGLLLSWSRPAHAWLPCGDLPQAWDALTQGLVPAPLPGAVWPVAALLALAGLALHAGRGGAPRSAP